MKSIGSFRSTSAVRFGLGLAVSGSMALAMSGSALAADHSDAAITPPSNTQITAPSSSKTVVLTDIKSATVSLDLTKTDNTTVSTSVVTTVPPATDSSKNLPAANPVTATQSVDAAVASVPPASVASSAPAATVPNVELPAVNTSVNADSVRAAVQTAWAAPVAETVMVDLRPVSDLATAIPSSPVHSNPPIKSSGLLSQLAQHLAATTLASAPRLFAQRFASVTLVPPTFTLCLLVSLLILTFGMILRRSGYTNAARSDLPAFTFAPSGMLGYVMVSDRVT